MTNPQCMLLVALMACFAAAPPGNPKNGAFEGRPAIVMSNDKLELKIALEKCGGISLTTGKLARGLEFGTQPYDVPRRDAISTGAMFGVPTYRRLPAKSHIETRFLLFYARVPEGFHKVDDVRIENGQLLNEDRTAQKRVILAASLDCKSSCANTVLMEVP